MFKQKDKRETPSLTSTVIGEGIRIEGNIISGSGSIRIDGTVECDISVDGDVTVGETGHIIGNIAGNSMLSAGTIEGNVLSKSGVHLTSTSKLVGDISSASLVIDEGAGFSGKCNMKDEKLNMLVYSKDNDEVETENEIVTEIEEIDPNLSYDKVN